MSDVEMRICQNCGAGFSVESEDFDFYKKISVPPPTFCFDCRVRRRMTFRNERTLYKRTCDAPGHGEQMISIFSPDNPQRVYCSKEWWGNNWDAGTYARDADFSKPFFTQIQELWREVPDIALLNINPVNSDYCSITEGNKNCYLVFGGDFNENTLYSTYPFNSKECVDTYWISKCEFNYETVDCISCSRLLYSRYCEGCYNSAFLFNCYNCHDCFGCVNLKNKSYCIWNDQYAKEEYLQKVKELDLENYEKAQELKKRFEEHKLRYPRRFARMLRAVNSTGDNLEQAKNCRNCFDIFGGGEDCINTWLVYSKVKDSMDVDRVGLNTELGYECSTIYPGSRVFFSRFTFNSHDVYYSYNSHNCAYLFGCVGMRNKQYCILNKQYTPEKYEEMKMRIIKHMDEMPYVSNKRQAFVPSSGRGGTGNKGHGTWNREQETGNEGIEYRYGEFFPPELSPFAYNETVAQEIFPLAKEQAIGEGYSWREERERNYKPTKTPVDLPRRIAEVSDSILNDIIACEHKGTCNEQCTEAFKIVQAELLFYRQMNIPLPRLCPSCRHYQRLRQRNPIKLWKRTCHCAGGTSESGIYKNSATHGHNNSHCPAVFETTYSPDRPEIIYCEACYQAEMA